MARLKYIALPCILLVALGGCSGFFDFNAFKGLDPVKVPAASDYQGAAGLDQLEEDLSSPAVVDAMTDQTVEEVEQMLTDDYVGDGVDNAEDQQAAVLLAEINLVTTSGDVVVNNIVNLITEILTSQQPPTPDALAADLPGIIPQDAMATPAAFAELIEGFIGANDAYTALGNSLPTLGAPEGVNLGDVAQKAVVCFVIATVIDVIEDSQGVTEAGAIGLLYELILDPANASQTLLDSLQPPDISPTNPDAAALLNIFSAIGLDLAGVLNQ
jgi:hypothetical protein